MVVMPDVDRSSRFRRCTALTVAEDGARRSRGFPAARSIPAVLLLAAFGFVPGTAQVSPEVSAVCALSEQSQEAPFDPRFVEFISHPRPLVSPFVNQDESSSVKVIARVLGVHPPVFQILDVDREALVNTCEVMRIYSVDARLRTVLPGLRFGDLTSATLRMARGIVVPLVLFELEKVQGEPVFFHKSAGDSVCSSGAPPLVVYRKHVQDTLIVRKDGSIYYRDKFSNVFDRQSLGQEDLARLMRSFAGVGFSGFASSLPPIDDGQFRPSVTLICTRHQRVVIPGREVPLHLVLAALDEVKAKALSGSFYRLKYDEKRPITFLDWPFPNLPLRQAEDIRKAAWSEEYKARESGGHATEAAAVFEDLPAGFVAKLPGSRFPPPSVADPNRDTFIREGSKLFRVEAWCSLGRANCRTFDGLIEREMIAADAFLAALPPNGPAGQFPGQIVSAWQPSDEEPPDTRLSDATFGLLWPANAPVRLDQVPPEGLPVSDGDLAKYPLYRELSTAADPGLRFVEGGYVYDGVRVARTEREVQTTPRGGAR